jgi:CRISPR-associated protein Cas1
MPTIYIRNSETTLAVDSSYFTIRSKGKRIGRIPPAMMEQVVVEHGVEITRTALDRLGALGIPVTFLGKEGRVQARLSPPWKNDPVPRLAQAAAHFDPNIRLRLAKRWVDSKLANSVSVLRRYLSNHSDPRLSEIVKEIQRQRDKIPKAENIPALFGMEGSAARLWFEALGKMLRTPWLTFSGRTRRPPLDPGNAVLSYSYAVISNQILACVEAVGLDPCIGYLHAPETRRASLVLDLLEPFRPALADRLALRLLNLGTLRPEHFHEPNGPNRGVFITMEGRSLVLSVLVEWVQDCDEVYSPGKLLHSPGKLLLQEVESFQRHAATGRLADFIPFHLDASLIRNDDP